MPRIRTLKPETWESEKLGRLSLLARLSFIGLISLADDEGRGRGDPAFLFARLHAYATDANLKDMRRALDELGSIGLAAFYQAGGCSYYAIPSWTQNQKIDRPNLSKLPAPPTTLDAAEHSTKARRVLDESSALDQGPGTKDQVSRTMDPGSVTPDAKASRAFKTPTVEEIRVYCKERGNSLDAQHFYDYYEARGWIIGKSHMKDWQASVRTWESNERTFAGKVQSNGVGIKPAPGKYDGISRKVNTDA